MFIDVATFFSFILVKFSISIILLNSINVIFHAVSTINGISFNFIVLRWKQKLLVITSDK